MAISLIVATSESGGIGLNNSLLFDCPTDMRRFRELSEDNFTVMGRNTYESLKSPLKNRINVIVSRQGNDYYIDPHLLNKYDIILTDSLERVINHYNSGVQEKSLCIIGGQSVYEQALPHAEKVYLTKFHHEKEYDTKFPLEYLNEHFEILHKEEHEDENGLRFDFIDYVRKENTDGEQ